MELVMAAIEEGGTSFIWFVVMLVAVWIALMVTVSR